MNFEVVFKFCNSRNLLTYVNTWPNMGCLDVSGRPKNFDSPTIARIQNK